MGVGVPLAGRFATAGDSLTAVLYRAGAVEQIQPLRMGRGFGGLILAMLLLAALALGAGPAHAESWLALTSSNTQYLPDAGAPLTPVSIGGEFAFPSITLDDFGGDVVVSPDARTGYVVSSTYWEAKPCEEKGPSDIQQIDLSGSTPVAGAKIAMGSTPPVGLAISPDGRTLYASSLCADGIIPIDLTSASPAVGSPITVGTDPFTVIVSPDGHTLYAANHGSNTVSVVDLTAHPAKTEHTIMVGKEPIGMAITPDGSKLFVADSGECAVTEIDAATSSPHRIGLDAAACEAGEKPERVAVAPDGAHAYVTVPAARTVVPIATASDTEQTPISFAGFGNFDPAGIAVTPDGRQLVVGDGYFGGSGGPFGERVEIVSLPGGGLTPSPIPLNANPSTPTRIAITPDQAPAANFTVASAPPGSATSFDASPSTVRFGTIARYDWSFGDGATAVTSTPSTSHVYTANGTYTASVTETDGAGTSTSGEVFTGQEASSVGNASASTSRSVVISSSGASAFSSSATSLRFGAVGVSTSITQVLAITNTGSAPLSISASGISGSGAGVFSLTRDGCTGTTVAVGAMCTVNVSFSPGASTAYSAQLAFTDNASGSPHTVFLGGSGVAYGIIQGIVSNASHRPAQPLEGASVSECLAPGFQNCQYTTTAADGTYRFANLTSGQYTMEVWPPGGSLRSASASVKVAPGVNRQSFALTEPVPLSKGVAFQTPGGTVASGTPTVNWNEPFSFDVPVKIPARAAPNSIQPVIVHGAIALSSGSSANGGFGITGSETLFVGYGSGGAPSGIVGVQDTPSAEGGAHLAGSGGGGVLETFNTVKKFLELFEAKALPDQGLLVTIKGPLGESGYTGEAVLRIEPHGNPKVQLTFKSPKGPKVASVKSCPVKTSPRITRIAEEVLGQTEDIQRELAKLAAELANKGLGELGNGLRWSYERAAEGIQGANQIFEKAGGELTKSALEGLKGSGGSLRFSDSPLVGSATAQDLSAIASSAATSAPATFEPQMRAELLIGETPASVLALSHPSALPINGDLVRFTVPALEQRVHGAFNWSYRTSHPGLSYGPMAAASSVRRHPRAHSAQAVTLGYEAAEECPEVKVTIEEEVEEDEEDEEEGGGGGGYIDPSGSVHTTHGAPVSGAKVVLLRSAAKTVRAKTVPNGSTLMSPANRRNPDLTDALGHFGWDVTPGYYQVHVSHPGCSGVRGHPLLSTLFAVPPPVVDLSFKLRCPRLRRSGTNMTLKAVHGPGRTAGLIVRVRSHGARAAGFVVFKLGGRVLGQAVLDSRTATATLEARLPVGAHVIALYTGDGNHAPSQARGTVGAPKTARARGKAKAHHHRKG